MGYNDLLVWDVSNVQNGPFTEMGDLREGSVCRGGEGEEWDQGLAFAHAKWKSQDLSPFLSIKDCTFPLYTPIT